MERKIGTKFKYKDIELEVVSEDGSDSWPCEGCYFRFMNCLEARVKIVGECTCLGRKDKTKIIFKKI